MRLISLWNLWEARSQPGSLLWRASGSGPVRRGLMTIKGRLEKPSWKSRGLCREGERVEERREGGGDERAGGGEESRACCRRNRILSWPVWSQRRNIRRWLQLDAAGGVRWVDGWGRREGVGVTHTGGRTLHSNGWTHMGTHTQTHSTLSTPSLATSPRTFNPLPFLC